tara:strand:+ start:442 stop:1572 length:1131 start_codon:yes stop_codon:yes gene_type:complete
MPADVNGTINIIAEVVGRGQSPSNNANVLEGRTAQETEKNRRGFLDLALDSKKIKLVIFGLLANSKILGTTLQSTARLIGLLVDVLLMPFLPILMAGMGFFASIVSFVLKVSEGDWSGIWTDLRDWWTTTWEEDGGLVGIIKAVLAGASGTAALTALIATFFIGPRAGLWVLQNTFFAAATNGYMLSKAFIGKLMGWTSTLFRGARDGGGSVLKTVGNALLSTAGLLKKLFAKITPVWAKDFLIKSWGLLKIAGKALTGTAANLISTLWKSRLLGVARIGGTWIAGLFGSLGLGGALATLGFYGLLLLAGVALMVTGFWVLNALSNMIFGKSGPELIKAALSKVLFFDLQKQGWMTFAPDFSVAVPSYSGSRPQRE